MSSRGLVSTGQGLLSSALGASLCLQATAQEDPGEEASLREMTIEAPEASGGYLETSSANPKFSEPLRDVAQTIMVIPEELIKDRGATTLRDVLRNSPGVTMQAGEGGTPAGDQMSIRGFSARTDMFVDGIRDVASYSRDPFNLEQVELSKGPASTISGRGSTGGALNLVSKTPKLEAANSATLGLGTDDYRRLTLDVNQPLEQIDGAAFRVNALWHDAGVPGRDVVENQRFGLAPSIAFGLETETRVTLSYHYEKQDNVPDYGIPWVSAGNVDPVLSNFEDEVAPVDFGNWYGLKDRDYEDVEINVVTGKVEHDLNDNVTLRNVSRYGQVERDSIVTAPRFVDIDPGTAGNQYGTLIRRSDWKDRFQTNEILANQTDFLIDAESGDLEHSIVAGFEVSREKEERRRKTGAGPDSPDTDVYNPNPNDPYTEAIAFDGLRGNESEADSLSIYLFDTVKLTEKWLVNGGLRWDRYDVDYLSRDAAGVETRLGRSDDMLSWRAGLVFKPRENGSIYFGYGTSFNPSGEALNLSASATSSANANAEPEESASYELGTKWDFYDSKLSLAAAVFRTDKHNSRTQDPSDPADSIVLEGEQRVDGIELSASGQITDRLAVHAGYVYMDSKVVSSKDPAEVGNELGDTPTHSASAWLTFAATDRLTVGAGAQYVGERYRRVANTRKVPDYLVFDAMASYRFSDTVSLRLNVKNLADEDYVDYVGGGHVIPGEGRSAMLTAIVDF